MSEGLMLEYLSVALASSLKFFAGPLTGLALGLSWYETALCSAAGMMASVLLTTYIGKGFQRLMARWRKVPARRFSRSSRLAVRIWKRFGMSGIALLTPLLFTPIGGTLLAVALRVPRHKLFVNMLVSAAVFGAVVSFLIFRLKFIQRFFGS